MSKLEKASVWALIFDGGKARLFQCRKPAFGEAPLVELDSLDLDNPPSHEQGRDKPGRAHSPSGARSALEAGDHHDQAEARFVAELGAQIEARAIADGFDKLVLIAPAQCLAQFEKAAPQAAARVVAKDAADLTNAPKKDLEARISGLLGSAG